MLYVSWNCSKMAIMKRLWFVQCFERSLNARIQGHPGYSTVLRVWGPVFILLPASDIPGYLSTLSKRRCFPKGLKWSSVLLLHYMIIMEWRNHGYRIPIRLQSENQRGRDEPWKEKKSLSFTFLFSSSRGCELLIFAADAMMMLKHWCRAWRERIQAWRP